MWQATRVNPFRPECFGLDRSRQTPPQPYSPPLRDDGRRFEIADLSVIDGSVLRRRYITVVRVR
jgi:hypothetical protein